MLGVCESCVALTATIFVEDSGIPMCYDIYKAFPESKDTSHVG
jgi:hypothetical protein